jgi:hypothetical protein
MTRSSIIIVLRRTLKNRFSRTIAADWNTEINCLWFFSALWFIAYFSAAFLTFEETEDFGVIAFIANLFEIGLILYISISIALIKQQELIKYRDVYFCWIAIPLTALVANLYSNRTVRTWLSVAAVTCGLFGLFCAQNSLYWYRALLCLMWFLLFCYFTIVFDKWPDQLNFLSRLDIKKQSVDCLHSFLVVVLIGAVGLIGYLEPVFS